MIVNHDTVIEITGSTVACQDIAGAGNDIDPEAIIRNTVVHHDVAVGVIPNMNTALDVGISDIPYQQHAPGKLIEQDPVLPVPGQDVSQYPAVFSAPFCSEGLLVRRRSTIGTGDRLPPPDITGITTDHMYAVSAVIAKFTVG